MIHNEMIDAMLQRKSIRRYTKEMPSDEILETIVRAGQQAPFAAQLYSILLSRKKRHPFGAPLLFTVCVDTHKMRLIMARRNWEMISNDLILMLFGLQDGLLMAENMVMAAESLGMGSCFLGAAPYMADKIARQYHLPAGVFPIVQLAMGYPAENPPPRPRYPLEFVLFEDEYPALDETALAHAMQEMDTGYLAQDYYRKARYLIPLENDRPETYTYDNYSWTEHISRKWGQWYEEAGDLLKQLSQRGYNFTGANRGKKKEAE